MKPAHWMILSFAVMAVLLFPKKTENSGMEGYGIKAPWSTTMRIGKWVSSRKDSTTDFEISYFFGQPQSCRGYYPDRSLKSEGSFSKGKPVGEWRSYHPNGRIESINVYEGSFSSVSLQKIFSIDGSLIFHSEDGRIFKDEMPRMKKTTEPNQSLQTTNRTVTECAPSRTFRDSAVRV